jgi:hypothetical protein
MDKNNAWFKRRTAVLNLRTLPPRRRPHLRRRGLGPGHLTAPPGSMGRQSPPPGSATEELDQLPVNLYNIAAPPVTGPDPIRGTDYLSALLVDLSRTLRVA